MSKFNFKDHPVIILSTTAATTILLCFAVLIPLHSMVIEQKDGAIGTKQATIDSLKDENEALRRRLQGDVVLVSTNELNSMRNEVSQIEGNISKQLQTLGKSLSQLGDIKAALDKSANQITPQDFSEIRRVANIRPNGRNVNWLGDRRGGAGIAMVAPSPLSQTLTEAFAKFNEHDTVAAADLFNKIISDEPRWPYAYFYLGLNDVNASQPARKALERAAQHFKAIREAGILEPELLLYESMSRSFLGETNTVRDLLAKLSEFNENVQDVTILAIPQSSPEDVQSRFRTIAEKQKLPLVKIDLKMD